MYTVHIQYLKAGISPNIRSYTVHIQYLKAGKSPNIRSCAAYLCGSVNPSDVTPRDRGKQERATHRRTDVRSWKSSGSERSIWKTRVHSHLLAVLQKPVLWDFQVVGSRALAGAARTVVVTSVARAEPALCMFFFVIPGFCNTRV